MAHAGIHTYEEALLSIPPSSPTFSGSRGTLTWTRWVGLTIEWLDAVLMPYRFRTSVAVTLLRGHALSRWTRYASTPGVCRDWQMFRVVLGGAFEHRGYRDHWEEVAREFYQLGFESLRQYEDRFEEEIVSDCPFALDDWEQQIIFYRGLRPEFRYPVFLHNCPSMGELRQRVEYLVQPRGGTLRHAVPPVPPPVVPPPIVPPVVAEESDDEDDGDDNEEGDGDPEEDPDEDPEEDPDEDPEEDQPLAAPAA